MPLDTLQRDIVAVLKSCRSAKSFVGGSSVFNETFPRMSDDIDIYAEDVDIKKIAERDVAALRKAGFQAKVDELFYGFAIEAIVIRSLGDPRGTKLEWTEADRRRFYPIQQNQTFGWTLHKTDLAIQKMLAAASRRKARDALDVLLIDHNYAPLAALAIAAPAKLENTSPIAILERILQIGTEHPIEDYMALRIDNNAMPFPINKIKTKLADTIHQTIDTITQACQNATPAVLYLANRSNIPVVPRDDILSRLVKHTISAHGTVPTFTAVKTTGKGRAD
jgi:hypothetical protein